MSSFFCCVALLLTLLTSGVKGEAWCRAGTGSWGCENVPMVVKVLNNWVNSDSAANAKADIQEVCSRCTVSDISVNDIHQTGLNGVHVLVIPRLTEFIQRYINTADLKNWISQGGSFVTMATGYHDNTAMYNPYYTSLYSTLYNWNLLWEDCSSETGYVNSSGTPYSDISFTNLPYVPDTYCVIQFPAEASAIFGSKYMYYSYERTKASVVYVPEGAGEIHLLAYDWMHPGGSTDSRIVNWKKILMPIFQCCAKTASPTSTTSSPTTTNPTVSTKQPTASPSKEPTHFPTTSPSPRFEYKLANACQSCDTYCSSLKLRCVNQVQQSEALYDKDTVVSAFKAIDGDLAYVSVFEQDGASNCEYQALPFVRSDGIRICGETTSASCAKKPGCEHWYTKDTRRLCACSALPPTQFPTSFPTNSPTTSSPTGTRTSSPTAKPTTLNPTPHPTTAEPTTLNPTPHPTTARPTTAPTTSSPTQVTFVFAKESEAGTSCEEVCSSADDSFTCSDDVQFDAFFGSEEKVRAAFLKAGISCATQMRDQGDNSDHYGVPYAHKDCATQSDACCNYSPNQPISYCATKPVDPNHMRLCACSNPTGSQPPTPPTSLPVTTEAPTSLPVTTEAPTSLPVTTEAPTSLPVTTEAPTSSSIPTPEEGDDWNDISVSSASSIGLNMLSLVCILLLIVH